MTDLGTRLRALADEPFAGVGSCIIPYRDALREAADALEAEETRRMMLNTSNGEWSKKFHALEQERDALKAKLAEADIGCKMYERTISIWQERAEKAEALIKVVFTPGTVTEEDQRVYDEWARADREEKP